MPDYATTYDFKKRNRCYYIRFCLKKSWLSYLKIRFDETDIDNVKNLPSGLSNLKSKVDKLDIGKLKANRVDLSKLINLVKNDVAKKTVYDCFKKLCHWY